MINAIILAAGESKRMGKPKPLLRIKNKTFLEQIIFELKLSDIDRITVVLGADAEKIKNSIDLSGTNMVFNENYRNGQLSSLIAGLKDIPEEVEAILVFLVDNPFITKEIVNKIISKFKEANSAIIVPVFGKKRGHPTLFSKSIFNEIISAPKDRGARYVIYSNREKTFEIKMNEKEILAGINTPEDYKKYFDRDPETL